MPNLLPEYDVPGEGKMRIPKDLPEYRLDRFMIAPDEDTQTIWLIGMANDPDSLDATGTVRIVVSPTTFQTLQQQMGLAAQDMFRQR